MAKCPQCNQPTLHQIRSDDPSVVAKCRKCGYYQYKKVKMTIEEFENIIYSMVTHQLKENPDLDAFTVLAYIVHRTGHTTQEVTEAYDNAKARNQGFG